MPIRDNEFPPDDSAKPSLVEKVIVISTFPNKAYTYCLPGNRNVWPLKGDANWRYQQARVEPAHTRHSALSGVGKGRPAVTGSSEGALAAIPMLRRHAILLLGNRNIADEMVGRCLVDGMKLLNGTRDGTAIRNVLLKILHARCQEELDVNASRGLAASGIGVTRADGAPDASTIEAVFDQLGFGDRAILLLISLERISYEDAAEILAIPLVVVASKVAGARRALNALSEVVKPPDPVRIR